MDSADQSREKRRSPAEAFDELKATVNRSAAEISDLWDFSLKVKDKLLVAADLHRLEGMLPVLDSMIQIHQILFARLGASRVESGKTNGGAEGADDAFILSLLETIEEELTRHGIEIVKPDPGAAFDVRLMECTQAVKKRSRKDKANTIASVNRCGFLYKLAAEPTPRIVAKAQVEVFEK